MNPIPLALYIHVPWCVKKCPYCDFNSHETQRIPETEYVAALLQDLQQDQQLAQGRSISSIFIGGGTPSLFSAAAYEQLLQEIDQLVPIEQGAEITLEANPGTFEYNKFRGFRKAGINRLSIGVQSFETEKLQALGRIHDREEAIRAIGAAQDVGFERINIDLMHGLPNQTEAQAIADLEQGLALNTRHLSWYQLTIEPNTVFYTTKPALPQDETLDNIDEAGKTLLQEAGFIHYETSAFAKPEFQCRHNLNYWLFGDYLAMGAGAHGKISDSQQKKIIRYQKTRLPNDYLNPEKAFTARQQPITEQDLGFEFFMNAFRLSQPIARTVFSERTFVPPNRFQSALNQAVQQGLITESATHWQTTELGQRFLNNLLTLFSN
ncbi:MAG: radical SAM family heme chaperone HemW [Ketobacter sp.]|nr:MAG: radical SAM family heme chaperone HemW [Ketobacter sp.]